MIQRVQSIFLFGVAACMITMLFFPIWNKLDGEKNELVELTALKFSHTKKDIETGEIAIITEGQTFYIAILAILAAGVALYSIFKYDNRLLQMKLGALNSLFMGGAMGLIVYHVYQAERMVAPTQQGNYLFAFYLGVSALLFNLLSNRFIRRDEKLVRSADRIR
ncbi:MAG: DUF4293 domain-containing protein [Reichenbachiella sp.]|uniref:DUF4293 domain-containing protein n=1 Tax=Reichenbachiella sp. TaxID=2184521 RepID=UPI0029671780|nr:DUF4293 domain-containing protein [Reichenbachiella sp.]MDW3212092.1 DUF4293 domain-containing protein [Reichenbachiella sp.]